MIKFEKNIILILFITMISTFVSCGETTPLDFYKMCRNTRNSEKVLNTIKDHPEFATQTLNETDLENFKTWESKKYYHGHPYSNYINTYNILYVLMRSERPDSEMKLLLEQLVQNGSDPNIGLECATDFKNPKYFDMFLKLGGNINETACLDIAATIGASNMVNLCLDNNINPDKIPQALYFACKQIDNMSLAANIDQIIETLLDTGCNPNVVDQDGISLLHFACNCGLTVKRNYKLAKLLLDSGADPNLQTNKSGNTPLHIFCNSLQLSFVYGEKEEYIDFLDLLLENAANPNIQSKDNGQTPLMIVAKKGYTGLVNDLMNHNADVNIKDSDGLKAYQYAENEEHYEIADLLNPNRLVTKKEVEIYYKSNDLDKLLKYLGFAAYRHEGYSNGRNDTMYWKFKNNTGKDVSGFKFTYSMMDDYGEKTSSENYDVSTDKVIKNGETFYVAYNYYEWDWNTMQNVYIVRLNEFQPTKDELETGKKIDKKSELIINGIAFDDGSSIQR